LRRPWPDPDTGDFVVEIELGKVPDALGEGWHLDAVKVCISSETRAITSTVFRQVHVWSLVREVIETQVKPLFELERDAPSLGHVSTEFRDGQEVVQVLSEAPESFTRARDAAYEEAATHLRLDEATERRTGRPRSVTPDFLREVATVWLAAKDHGEPRAAVAHHFGDAALSTAGRWITKARDAGLIPASGRARKQEEQS
jgi:hypothetical protein